MKTFPEKKEDCRKEAIDLIKKFLKDPNEKVKCIDDFDRFSFWDINNKSSYGNGLGKPDADRTKLAYAIDYLLYSESELPDFKIYGYSGNKSATYSGETLNTFNTLFSSTKMGRYKIAELWKDKENFLKKIFDENSLLKDDFYHVYQRLGNLTLLPCKTIGGGSINTLKGCSSEVNDYLYPFMINLEKAYCELNNVKNEDYFESLIKKDNRTFSEELLIQMQVNHFFFEKIDTFDKFVEVFMLKGWENLKLDKYLRNSELDKDNINIAIEYVDKATAFIDARTTEIIKKLKALDELKDL